MSNALALAAVTATIRDLIDQDTDGVTVSALPLDKVSPGATNQINIFLYQVLPNAAWRNQDIPRQVRPGETALSPLAISLHYLVTAYGDGEVDSHRLLGQAMSILHDNPILGAEHIRAATSGSVPGNDLDRQVERVRLTWQPMSLEEMSKLWPGFQTQYRLSAAYEASVVLIESTRSARTPLPVLTRGPADQGVLLQPNLIPPYPFIESVTPPSDPDSVQLGETLTISGHNLAGPGRVVRFASPRQTGVWDLPAVGADQQITVTLPNDPGTLASRTAGLYSLCVVFDAGAPSERSSNSVPLAIAPTVTNISPKNAVRDAEGNVTLTVTCAPEVGPFQRASLLLSGREVLANPITTKTDTLVFLVKAAAPGSPFVRLRVDGADSLVILRTPPPPKFDATQQITIT
jgi:hypothetical protein